MSESSSTNGIPQEVLTVSEQSLSPESRTSHIHSRNSSKTLKCPKCNWHYKYQETLEIHLKEKHQIGTNFDGIINNCNEGEINCSYCLSNNVHPRLARGEQYPCGFKPYRCDLCLYSTTTKGNLAIHMQSDKHMNNSRDLSSPTIHQLSTCTSSPDNSLDQTSQSQEMKVSSEYCLSSSDKFSCPLCSESNMITMESLKEHLCSNHNCTEDALTRCLALIGDSDCMGENSDKSCSSDEYRCHSCQNETFKHFHLLLNHFQDQNHIDEENENVKSVGLLCWKKGCNQYFTSLIILQKHFNEIHNLNIENVNLNNKTTIGENKIPILSKSRERLISIGEDLVLHYLENSQNEENKNEIICDLCLKSFSSLTTLKVHYEDIHSIILSSRAIQHWLFLLQKLHDLSSVEICEETKKLKRQSSSLDLNEIKKSRYETYSSSYADQNNKRQRTRITDEQLRILRAHFNINNSPSDEQILFMSQKSSLTSKVIKHWFRNTLFKERQRNKDSPYNFSNPPSLLNQIDLDEYQKTGTIIKKLTNDSEDSENDFTSNDEQELLSDDNNDDNDLNKITKQQSRRANRTRFSDQQLRLLQDAFEANPYPKDDDLEILSQKLKLNSRVIVVWFQNARQKARKSYENNQTDIPSTQCIIKQDKDEGYSCKNCQKLFTRFAELMKHAKQCSSSSSSSSPSPNKKYSNHKIKSEPIDQNPSTSIDALSSYQMLVAAASMAAVQQQQQQFSLTPTFTRKENYCDQCDKSFNSLTDFNEHQTLHMQALINAAAFFPLAAYHPTAAACAAAMAQLGSQMFNNIQTPTIPCLTTPLPTPTTPILNDRLKGRISSAASDCSNEMFEEDGGTSIDSNDENRLTSSINCQKRNRTTILPEQQDYLMTKYSIESNPSRKMLEDISSEVKLKKRVVQVWFQNTRARERKGNIKIEPSGIGGGGGGGETIETNKKCLHCSARFKSKFLFENHLLTKHNEIYINKEDFHLIDFDSFEEENCDLPLDLSKSSHIDIKKENEDFINQWNDQSSNQSSDNEHFTFNSINQLSQKIISNGHISPTPSIISSNGINGQRRFRTQMTPLQIKLMKAIFLEYRTPTMPECELLGKEIELQKRVVQVWFQNARAKEKKNPHFFKSDLPEEYQPTNELCKLCICKYTLQNPQRDHLFTTKHIENIRLVLSKQIVNVSNCKDETIKKNSMINKLDLQTTVLDKSSEDDQNQLMSYLNLMHLMPLGMDPYNYGLMDPNIHGTPMFMLQLPPEALQKIVALTKSDGHLTCAQYTQDGKSLENLIDNGQTSCDYQTIDVGFACKRCNLVWPLYESCRCHALLCCQISSSTLPICINSRDDLNSLSGYIFKIEQLAYRCLLCKSSSSTILEYEKHTKDEIHLKKKRLNSTIEEND